LLFNSYQFVFVFLPLLLIGYELLALNGARSAVPLFLVLGSLFFYGWWNWRYLLLFGFSIAFNYSWAQALRPRPPAGADRRFAPRAMLAVGAAINLGLLGYFKYRNFFVSSAAAEAGRHWTMPPIVLPLAISFFTFEQLTYLTSAWRGKIETRDFLSYALQGVDAEEAVEVVRVALRNPKLKRIVWGLDFFSFDDNRTADRETMARLQGDAWTMCSETLLNLEALDAGRREFDRACHGHKALRAEWTIAVPWPQAELCRMHDRSDRAGLDSTGDATIRLQLLRDVPDYTGYRLSERKLRDYAAAVALAHQRGVEVIAFVPPINGKVRGAGSERTHRRILPLQRLGQILVEAKTRCGRSCGLRRCRVLLHPLVDSRNLSCAKVRRFDYLRLGARGRDPSAGRLVHRREFGKFLGMRAVGKVGHQRRHEERAKGGAALRGQRLEVRLYEGQREFRMLSRRYLQDEAIRQVSRYLVGQRDGERFLRQFGIHGGGERDVIPHA
jgi:hypothetical protein